MAELKKIFMLNVPCLLVNERYQIYLDSGVIYDREKAEDIPQFVFDIRDRIMGRRLRDAAEL